MKTAFVLCLFVLIISPTNSEDAIEEETEHEHLYSSFHGGPLFANERNRKATYCARACDGYSLITETCSEGRLRISTQDIYCLCSKFATRIRNSYCWTDNNRPTGNSMKRRFESCQENCKADIFGTKMYAALCNVHRPKPSERLVRDCFCVPFRDMQPPPSRNNEDIKISTGNQCSIFK